MTQKTSSTSDEASVSTASPVDQIADLFVEDEKDQASAEPDLDIEDEDDGDEEVDDQEGGDERDEDASEEDEDVTWEGVLGVDQSKLVLDEDGNFKGIKVKVDGQESDVDINTLINGYQTARSTTQKSQALAEERRAFEQSRTQAIEVFQTKLREADALVGALEKSLVGDYQNVDLQRLRHENPGEYAAMMADQQRRYNEIAMLKQQISQNYNAADNVKNQELEAQQRETVAQYAQKAVEMFPDWNDPKKVQADFDDMRSFVSDFGFTDDEFNSVIDPRMLAVVKTALDAKTAKTQSAEKVVNAKAKIRKTTRSRSRKNTSKLDKLVQRAQKATGAGKRGAQTDAIAELLMNG